MTDLPSLIELAKTHVMPQEEKDAQVKSFAYGNTKLANPDITREGIDHAFNEITNSK